MISQLQQLKLFRLCLSLSGSGDLDGVKQGEQSNNGNYVMLSVFAAPVLGIS